MSTADRRRRTEEALASRDCEACGWSWWMVNGRGDSHCVVCRELEAGSPPRCGTCQRTDGWETVDGRKRCGCATAPAPGPRPAAEGVAGNPLASRAAWMFASREGRP